MTQPLTALTSWSWNDEQFNYELTRDNNVIGEAIISVKITDGKRIRIDCFLGVI